MHCRKTRIRKTRKISRRRLRNVCRASDATNKEEDNTIFFFRYLPFISVCRSAMWVSKIFLNAFSQSKSYFWNKVFKCLMPNYVTIVHLYTLLLAQRPWHKQLQSRPSKPFCFWLWGIPFTYKKINWMRSIYSISLTHGGRVTQICVFNTAKLGTSASSP